MKLNPALFDVIYRDLLNARKTQAKVEAALASLDDYMASRAEVLFAPLLAYLREAGEARSCAEVDDYFSRHIGVGYASAAFEYLADQGLAGKVSLPATADEEEQRRSPGAGVRPPGGIGFSTGVGD